MALSATGLGSGLDVQGIVEQLVAAERQPVANRLNLQEARTNAELSALGQFKSALSSFRDSLDALSDITKFQQRTTTVSDDTLIGASADSTAVPGNYSLEVTALATRGKLASAAFASSSAVVGNGTLNISVNGLTSSVVITPEASTLADIRDAINEAPDNPGVDATIINAADGAYLVLTSRETGANQGISLQSVGGDGGLDQLVFDPLSDTNPMTQIDAPTDALLVIDGFTITSAKNSVTGAIEGVSIDLLEASPGTQLSLSVGLDDDAAKAAVGSFVNAYNGLIDVVSQVTSFDAETGEAGPLLGDATVRGIKDQLRRELGSAVEALGDGFRTLTDIGISTQPSGRLELDEGRLSDAIGADFDGVGELFASEDGVAVRLLEILENALSSTSTINLRETGLKDRLEFLGDQRVELDERMERVQARLLDQFNAMDQLISSLQNTSSFLTRQLG
jgi:flagellar hook-associated protein 2